MLLNVKLYKTADTQSVFGYICYTLLLVAIYFTFQKPLYFPTQNFEKILFKTS